MQNSKAISSILMLSITKKTLILYLRPILVTLCLCAWTPASSQAIENIRFATFPSYGKNAGFYLAQATGQYEKLGVQVEIVNTFQNTLTLLQSGDADISQALCSDAFSFNEQGADFVIVAVRDAKFPVGTVSLPGSGIRSPSDYVGKRWGMSIGFSPEQRLLPALGRRLGFDSETVEHVNVDFPSRLPALLTGQVDFISAWWGSGFAAQKIAAQSQGVDLSDTFIRWTDYGIDIYGECLTVREGSLRDDSKALSSFLKASIHGFNQALGAPAEAIEAIIQMSPDLQGEKEVIALQWEQSADLLFDDLNKDDGLFHIYPSKLARTRNLIVGTDLTRSLESSYTNSLIP